MGAAPSPASRTWAEIDRAAFAHNLRALRAHLGPGPAIMAVVKADAYGHGAGEVVAATRGIADAYAVANVVEAADIAPVAAGKDILILGPCLPAEYGAAVRGGFVATVSGADETAALAAVGPIRVNFKIDTGMGRIGASEDSAVAELARIARIPGVAVYGISIHLPSADADTDFTRGQLARFGALLPELRPLAPGAKIHALHSAGVLGFPGSAHDLVRIGLALYGASPLPGFQGLFRPALTWKTRVILVRDVAAGSGVSYGRTFITTRPMRLATLAVGYADGYHRALSGRGAEVLLGGRRCAVLGRVTMDQIVADAGPAGDVHPGDEAVLIGAQGEESILAGELAEKAGTIPWEIFTGLGRRVTRYYR